MIRDKGSHGKGSSHGPAVRRPHLPRCARGLVSCTQTREVTMAPERSSDVPTDFAVAVTREDGIWVVSNLPPRAADHLEPLVHALKQLPAEGGAIGLVSYVEEFFLVARTTPDDVRLLLSDIGAAPEWPLGAEVLEHLGLPMPDDEDLEQVQPAGDIALLQDLGLDAME